ncbi:MAG: energy-coupled thiamine transporter ThiT [Bacillales bacterium]|nr:energy-coupled thiamine transporter ThiT [Bacillales bacterium]
MWEIITYSITGLYIIFTFFVFYKKREKLTIKKMCLIAAFAAIAIVSYYFIAIPFFWGSEITFGPIAIMLAGFLLGAPSGIITGIITFLVCIPKWGIIHPAQIATEYYFCFTALGLTGLFKTDRKNVTLGVIIVSLISLTGHFLTGVIFYGQYAPDGMAVWWYSLAYNFLSDTGSILVCYLIIMALPLKTFAKIINKNKKVKIE